MHIMEPLNNLFAKVQIIKRNVSYHSPGSEDLILSLAIRPFARDEMNFLSMTNYETNGQHLEKVNRAK